MSRTGLTRDTALLCTSIVFGQMPSPASATEFTAGVLMEKMEAEARVPFIQGIVHGLAYARYKRDNEHAEGDKRDEAGMTCIYDWFFKKPHTLDAIYIAFGKFPEYPPAAIINSLVKQECGA